MEIKELISHLMEAQKGQSVKLKFLLGCAAGTLERLAGTVAMLEDQMRWLSVEDRLPEDDKQLHFYDDGRMRCITVLAYTEYGRIIPKNRLLVRPTGNEYLDSQVTGGWIWASGSEEVTHWRPLPEEPKGDHND